MSPSSPRHWAHCDQGGSGANFPAATSGPAPRAPRTPRPTRLRAGGPRDRKVARRPRVPTRTCGCGWLPRAVSTGNGNVQFFNRDVALAHRRGQQGRAAAPRAAQVRTSAACRSGTAAPQRERPARVNRACSGGVPCRALMVG